MTSQLFNDKINKTSQLYLLNLIYFVLEGHNNKKAEITLISLIFFFLNCDNFTETH